VWVIVNLMYVDDAYISRKHFIEPKFEIEINGIVKVEMEKELAGMNHGIGSPASYTGYGFV
jgi:hypothetical protein